VALASLQARLRNLDQGTETLVAVDSIGPYRAELHLCRRAAGLEQTLSVVMNKSRDEVTASATSDFPELDELVALHLPSGLTVAVYVKGAEPSLWVTSGRVPPSARGICFAGRSLDITPSNSTSGAYVVMAYADAEPVAIVN
jgi:hypothetical protein